MNTASVNVLNTKVFNYSKLDASSKFMTNYSVACFQKGKNTPTVEDNSTARLACIKKVAQRKFTYCKYSFIEMIFKQNCNRFTTVNYSYSGLLLKSFVKSLSV